MQVRDRVSVLLTESQGHNLALTVLYESGLDCLMFSDLTVLYLVLTVLYLALTVLYLALTVLCVPCSRCARRLRRATPTQPRATSPS